MPAAIVPRDEVVRRLFGAFRTHGYEGATLARLSEATGLGRASLYHYFPDGKEGMVREVLGVAREWIAANIAGPLARSGTPSARLKATIKNVIAGYEDGNASCVCNLLGIGDAHAVTRDALLQTATAFVRAFSGFFEECGMPPARAKDTAIETVAQIEGALVMARALDDHRIFAKRMDRLEKELLELVR
jgi:AcrR family transcriptional regulator